MMKVKVTEYYNMEKAAEVLGVPTAEINRLREKGKLRGFRDGGVWKFLKEEVHDYLAETIKSRNGNGHNPGDSGFDLGGDAASASSFDLLVEDGALPDDSGLISVATPPQSKSDLDLAALDQEDSDLALAEETQVSSFVPQQTVKKAAKEHSSLSLAPDQAVHEVDFDDQESILEAGDSSPQLGLAGESGFDVLVAADEESELVQLDAESTEISDLVEEFILEPSAKVPGDDDSESSSQVIAIDVGVEMAQDDSPFGDDNFGFLEMDGGVSASAIGAPSVVVDDPFGVGGAPVADAFSPLAAAAPVVAVAAKKTAVVAEEEYSTGVLVSLAVALVLLLIPGIMMIDMMMHMWSWGEPFILNSVLMGAIAGMFGL